MRRMILLGCLSGSAWSNVAAAAAAPIAVPAPASATASATARAPAVGAAAGAGATAVVATSPATAPVVRTQDMLPIADGTIRYLPPAGWELVGKSPDNLVVTYQLPDGAGRFVLTVTPQTQAIQESAKGQMAMIIGKGIRDAAKREGRELVYGPRVEPDERYFLKMHDVINTNEGKLADRVQMYRVVGLNLVHMACTARVDAREEAAEVHADAERVLDTMRVARGAKRSVYPRAQLRAIVPLDWREQRTDQANGLVATYTDPKEPSRQIVLRCRVLPKEAREPGPKRDALLERMVDDERRQPPLAAGSAQDEQPVAPPASEKYLKHVRVTVKVGGAVAGGAQGGGGGGAASGGAAGGGTASGGAGGGGAGGGGAVVGGEGSLRVETRYLVVGDVLASVRSVAREPDADEVNAIADQVAADLKPIRD